MRTSAFSVILTKALFLVAVPLFFFLATCVLFSSFPFAMYANEGGTESELEQAVVEDTADSAEKIGSTKKNSEYSVTPVVANEKAKPRDIIKKELLVTNNTEQRIDLYITVENIDPELGAQVAGSPAGADLSSSLANWIEITRGVIELSPGESRKIPYLIHVNLTAKPGSYFARIQFSKGSSRVEAKRGDDGSSLMLNLEVYDDATERLQLGNFMANDSVVFGKTVGFSFLVENVGNRLIEPRGSIRIFNRRGEEVGSVPLNANGEEINPENKRQLATAWSTAGRFGKYKAFLDLEYGENQLASVQDTLYFWVFPWKEIFTALIGVLVLAVAGTYIVHMRAIAQPARAVSNRSEPPPPPPAGSQYDFPRARQSSFEQRTSSPRGHVTHLRVADTQKRNVVPPSKRNTVARQGAQVTLQSRSQTQVHGNVIQLSSRR